MEAATMKQSVYLETTIPSYLAAHTSSNSIIAGKQAATHEFWKKEKHKYDLYVSDYVYEECEKGDPDAAIRRLNWIENITVLEKTPAVEPLANTYMQILSIPEKNRIDAFHLAICCVHEINILLSWNCAHLGTASMQIVQRFNDARGLHTPQMTTPISITEVEFDG
jgi:hypothetical protein